MNTDRILTIPAEEYHAESRNGRYMSSHLLADFRESPELYNQPPLRVGGRSPVRHQALPREQGGRQRLPGRPRHRDRHRANGGERILRTVRSPACIAKNRFNLPGEIPLSWSAFMEADAAGSAAPAQGGEANV